MSVTLAIGILESLLQEDNQARVAKALNASGLAPAAPGTYARLALALRRELGNTDIAD